MKRWIHAASEPVSLKLLNKITKAGYGAKFFWDNKEIGSTQWSTQLGGLLSDEDIEDLIDGETLEVNGHEVRVEYDERI